MKLIWLEFFILGVREGDTILIWGYGSTKRLRTGVLYYLANGAYEI